MALQIPDIDSDLGFIHTLFVIEDIHGIRAETVSYTHLDVYKRQYQLRSVLPLPFLSVPAA